MQISYPHEQLPLPGSALEVVDGVLWIRMPLPFALDHINLWLLRDGAGWTAVDTGIGLAEVKDSWRKLLPSYPLRRQIVTHYHHDHFGLAGWLERKTGATLWMSQGEYLTSHMIHAQQGRYGNSAMLDLYRRHGLDESAAQAIAKLSNAYMESWPEAPATYRRLFDGQNIVIDGRDWRVMIGHGHSPEHAALYCAELNLLISGDMLLPRITTNISVRAANPDDNPLGMFLDSIADFKQLPKDTLVLPSHGKPFRGMHARVAALERHHAAHFRALLAAIDQPKSAVDLLPVLFSRSLADSFQLMMAMGETVAHVNYLEHARQIERAETDGGIRFVKSR